MPRLETSCQPGITAPCKWSCCSPPLALQARQGRSPIPKRKLPQRSGEADYAFLFSAMRRRQHAGHPGYLTDASGYPPVSSRQGSIVPNTAHGTCHGPPIQPGRSGPHQLEKLPSLLKPPILPQSFFGYAWGVFWIQISRFAPFVLPIASLHSRAAPSFRESFPKAEYAVTGFRVCGLPLDQADADDPMTSPHGHGRVHAPVPGRGSRVPYDA